MQKHGMNCISNTRLPILSCLGLPSSICFRERYLNSYHWFKLVQRGDSISVKDENDAVRMRRQWIIAAFCKLGGIRRLPYCMVFYLQQEFESVLPKCLKSFSRNIPKCLYAISAIQMNDKVIASAKPPPAVLQVKMGDRGLQQYQFLRRPLYREIHKGKMFYIDMWATPGVPRASCA